MAIQQIGRRQVTSPEQFQRIIKDLPANTPIPMLIRQGHQSLYVVMHLPPRS
jgi:serine protease Do